MAKAKKVSRRRRLRAKVTRKSARRAGLFSVKAIGRGGFYSLMKKVLPTQAAGPFKPAVDLVIIGEVGNLAKMGTRHMSKTGIDIAVATAIDIYVVPKLMGTFGNRTSGPTGGRTN